jgi:YD repeat-containing protein
MKNLFWLLLSFIVGISHLNSAFAQEFIPPKVSAVDKYGVNLANGQISTKVETVSIGGVMGLSHNISGYTNHLGLGTRGYQDKFFARAKYGPVGRNSIAFPEPTPSYIYGITVYDFEGSARFLVSRNGVSQKDNATFSLAQPSTIIFEPLGDERNSLAIDPNDTNYFNWTKPDGTVVRFEGLTNSVGFLRKITYPNGFTISVDGAPYNVRANTGFHLKYIFKNNDTGIMDPSKPDNPLLIEPIKQTPPPSGSWTAWSQSNPVAVKGINSAVEYCVSDYMTECNSQNVWPNAKFNWPNGMPRTLYINYPINAQHPTLESGVFSVVDSIGRTTEFHYRAYDLAYARNGGVLSDVVPNTRFSPRVVAIKSATSKVNDTQYEYQNNTYEKFVYISSLDSTTFYLLGSTMGVVTAANTPQGHSAYTMGVDPFHQPAVSTLVSYSASDAQTIEVAMNTLMDGSLNWVKTLLGQTVYEASWRNLPLKFFASPGNGPDEVYEYAPALRGNLTKMIKGQQIMEAGYLPTLNCTNPKTCNKPLWTKDPKGNQTDYTYHEPSGQVATVTSPANAQGIRAQTRYGYEQKFANYFQDTSGVKKISPTGIWLKTSEKTCTKTATTGDACSGGPADEVVTRYEYNSDNLFLTGMTVTADGTTRRTCYQYDIYGNRISETKPKAGLTSCPN